MDVGCYSENGPRDVNEDDYFAMDLSNIRSYTAGITTFILVSDGMGGYGGGEIASQITVSCAENYINQLPKFADENQNIFDPRSALTTITQDAHEKILAEARAHNKSMGATFIGAFINDNHAWIGHIGDSRAYIIRDGVATRITEDHSQVGRMLARGLITEEEAQNHPDRNRIEQALGFSGGEPEINEVDLYSGDALLLCSDGVYTALNASAIADCVNRSRSAKSAAKRIVETALRKGTDDNATAVVAINTCNIKSETISVPARRRLAPTIRMNAVRNPRHGRKADQASKKKKTPIILWLAIGLIIGFLIAMLIMASPKLNSEENPSENISEEQLTEREASRAEKQQEENLLSEDIQTRADYALFKVGNDMILKYVDRDGVAHRFDESKFSAPNVSIIADSTVTATVNAETYGYADEGKSYRALGDGYYGDLLKDLSLYKENPASYSDGAVDFSNSSLAKIIDPADYVRLLDALSEADVSLDSDIAALILDSRGLYQQDS